MTACGYCGGNFPQGISKGNSLRYAFGSFSRKRKETAGVGCVTPQAEPAPDFASWHTVRFLLYHAEGVKKKNDFVNVIYGYKA